MGAVVCDERCEEDSAEVGRGVFVVAGRDAAPLLESVESPFDGVALSIERGIERWRSAAGGSLRFAPGDLVCFLWNRVPNPHLTQSCSGRVVRIGFVGQDPNRGGVLDFATFQ